MEIGSKTDRGMVRELNEDALGYHHQLFVVADGMGGHEAGEIASAIAVEVVLKMEKSIEPSLANLEMAILKANEAILSQTNERSELQGMGTTIVALWVFEERGLIAHVGDSRIYHLRNGNLTKLTEDHSLVAELVKNGGLTEAEAKNHPQRNILIRALGTKTSLEVSLQEISILNGDKFLLCTDGLTGMLEESEIQEILSCKENLQVIAEILVAAANEAGGNDNISVIVIEV